jgi:Tol biopolymer transport system component
MPVRRGVAFAATIVVLGLAASAGYGAGLLREQRMADCARPPAHDTVVAWATSGIVVHRTNGAQSLAALAKPGLQRLQPLAVSGESGAGIWSPDGTKVATTFSVGVNGERRMDVVEVDGRRLFSVEDAVAVNWSPESDRLAYTTGRANADLLNPTIRVTDVSAGRTIVIGPGWTPSWSPDGTRLVFARVIRTNDEFVPPSLQFATQVVTASADGGDEQVILARAGGSSAGWSFDGRFLAFVRGDRDPHGSVWIEIVREDGSHVRTLPVRAVNVSFAWSPRRLEIAFTQYNKGFGPHRAGIVSLSGQVRRLPAEQLQRLWIDKIQPFWSPDGNTIAYTVQDLTAYNTDGLTPSGRSEIWLANARTLRESRLTSHCTFPVNPTFPVVIGTHLSDRIIARDRRRQTIACGAGNDTVTADRADRTLRDCEVVRRK